MFWSFWLCFYHVLIPLVMLLSCRIYHALLLSCRVWLGYCHAISFILLWWYLFCCYIPYAIVISYLSCHVTVMPHLVILLSCHIICTIEMVSLLLLHLLCYYNATFVNHCHGIFFDTIYYIPLSWYLTQFYLLYISAMPILYITRLLFFGCFLNFFVF